MWNGTNNMREDTNNVKRVQTIWEMIQRTWKRVWIMWGKIQKMWERAWKMRD